MNNTVFSMLSFDPNQMKKWRKNGHQIICFILFETHVIASQDRVKENQMNENHLKKWSM